MGDAGREAVENYLIGEYGIDITPDAFTFIDQTGVELSTVIESNSIAVTGISNPVAISISGADGEYAVSTDNGSTWGGWTDADGTVANTSKVKVRVTSSVGYAATVNTALDIGGVSDTFSVTTGPEPTTTTTSSVSTTTTSALPTTSTTSIVPSTTTTVALTTSTTSSVPTTTTTAASTSTTTSLAPTTTTTAELSTTTTVSKCPFVKSSGEPGQAKSLRQLRDSRLATALGALLATRYYQNMEEIGAILQGDAEMKVRFNRLVRDNMPVVTGLMKRGTATMRSADILELHGFLLDLQSRAGVKLQQDIEFVLHGIESGWLLGWSGITVE